MLSPEMFDGLADDVLDLYSQFDEAVLRDIVRRMTKTGDVSDTAAWQAKMLQESGMLYDDIIRRVAQLSDASEAHVRGLFEDAAVQSMQYDSDIYRAAGLSPIPLRQSPAAAQVLQAMVQKTNGHLRNLTLTTAATSQGSFIDAVTMASMKLQSGAFSYTQAIRDAIQQVAQGGTTVLYPSGHRDQLDVAVRRATLTGVSQTAAQISLRYADDMGCDLVETTAHPGARSDHMVWQGKVFSRSGQHSKYRPFEASTGYGTGAGLCGWNCRHSFYPFFEGLSSSAYPREKLREYEAKTVEYDGQALSYYDATQKQREMERAIRATKRELAGYDEGMKSDSPEVSAAMRESFKASAVKLKQQEEHLNDFLGQTGLDPQRGREQKLGFSRSQAQKAVQANKTIAGSANSMYNLGNQKANIKAYFRDKPLRDRIKSSASIKTLEPGQFRKHVPGTNEYKQYVAKMHRAGQYGPSRLNISAEEAQRLIDKYHGTGILSRDESGKWRNEEIITVHPDTVGIVVNNRTGAEAITSVFKIKYGPRGTHVVPDYPSKKGAKATR